jgi:L-iditol 2-dehydrogenase
LIDRGMMKQAVIRTPTTFEVVSVPRPVIEGPEEFVIRSAASGICSGDLMEWYLQKKVGTVLGHEVVGYVEEVGDEVTHVRPGDLVFVHHHAPCLNCRACWHRQYVQCETWKRTKIDPGGMAEYIRVPAENARHDSFEIGDLLPEVGLFIEPLACSVKAILLAQPHESDLAIVIGCGIMGLLNIQVAKALGTREVWAVEPIEARQAKAREVGADRVLSPTAMAEEMSASGFAGADYVVVGPGFPAVIEQATRMVRGGGSVILFTPTASGERTNLDLGDLYFREVRLLPAYSCGPTDTRKAYELLRTGRVDVRPILTHRYSLDEVQLAYNTAKGGGVALKVIVEFPAA